MSCKYVCWIINKKNKSIEERKVFSARTLAMVIDNLNEEKYEVSAVNSYAGSDRVSRSVAKYIKKNNNMEFVVGQDANNIYICLNY